MFFLCFSKPVSLAKSALPVRHENSCTGATREHTKILDQPKLLQDEAALTFLHNYGSRGMNMVLVRPL